MIGRQSCFPGESLLMDRGSNQEVTRVLGIEQAETGAVRRHLDIELPPTVGTATQACRASAVAVQRENGEGITRKSEIPASARMSA